MILMTVAIYKETKRDIDQAYLNNNIAKIEKETSFILNQLIVTMLSFCKSRIKGISIEPFTFKSPYILSQENQQELSTWLDRIHGLILPISDLELGKLIIDLANWYDKLGGKEIHFEYQESYLLTPREAAEQLGISTVTLNKYVKQGFECTNTTSHHKIPKHAVAIWKDPVYAIKMQMIAQKRKLQHQSPEKRINEINQELLEFQKKYKAKNPQDAFNGYDIDGIDDPSEYYEWRDLEEEKDFLLSKLIEDSRTSLD